MSSSNGKKSTDHGNKALFSAVRTHRSGAGLPAARTACIPMTAVLGTGIASTPHLGSNPCGKTDQSYKVFSQFKSRVERDKHIVMET